VLTGDEATSARRSAEVSADALAEAERGVLAKRPDLLARVDGVVAEYVAVTSRMTRTRLRDDDLEHDEPAFWWARPWSIRDLPVVVAAMSPVGALINLSGGKYSTRGVPLSNVTAATPDPLDVVALVFAALAVGAALVAVLLTKGPLAPALLGMSAALLSGAAFVAVFVDDSAVNQRVAPWFVACAAVVVGAAVASCVRWLRGDRLRRRTHDGAGERIDRWRAGLSVEYERALYRLDELWPDGPGDRRAARAERDEAVAVCRRAAGAWAWDGRSPRDHAPLGVYVLDARVPEAAAARRAAAPPGARR
jgi:hypothetical protein